MNKKIEIPTLETVKKGIDELLLIENWDKYKIRSSPKKFEKRFDALLISKLKLLPFLIYLANGKSLPQRFYRLRKQTKSFNESLISEYSYPPNHIVKSIQRANIPYHPVFYCSDNPYTAIKETLKYEATLNTKTFYYMSEWIAKSDQEIRVCPFIFDNVDEANPYKLLSDLNKKRVYELLKDEDVEKIKGFWEVLKFLSNLFVYENTYVVSSYLAYSNLYAHHIYRPDIFIYPSIQTKRKSVNFAIHPNSIAEKFQLTRIFKLRISEHDQDTNKYTALISWIGQNNNGIINWIQLDDKTEEGKSLLAEIDSMFKNA